ncbi:MAG: hypothetical protein FWD58_02560 [Firmicutes bacterium]|nr:hypothetical protein [Bacillota bacterium]
MFRTIEQAFALIKKSDPNTALTKYAIRKMAKSGAIRTLDIEKKTLIDFKSLLAHLGIELVI